jgi:hypothetical protein
MAGARNIGPVDPIGTVPENTRSREQPTIAPKAQPPGNPSRKKGALGDWVEYFLAQAKAPRKLIPREVVGHGGTQITSKDHSRQQNGTDYHRPGFKGSGENYREHYQDGPSDHLDGWTHWCGSLSHGGSILTDANGT